MEELNKIPQCIGIIIDGNRRWARAQHLPTFKGHEAGYEKLKDFVLWAKDLHVAWVVAYVFSVENWKRSSDEVNHLMSLIMLLSKKDFRDLHAKGVRIRIAGDRSLLTEDVRRALEQVEEDTRHNTAITLVLALSYGGRDEIIHAVNMILKNKESLGEREVTKEEFARYLWTHDMPDPDIIIRTSGEMRLSNFLPWQGTYSELFFPDKLWPDFSREDFLLILKEYNERERRFGK